MIKRSRCLPSLLALCFAVPVLANVTPSQNLTVDTLMPPQAQQLNLTQAGSWDVNIHFIQGMSTNGGTNFSLASGSSPVFTYLAEKPAYRTWAVVVTGEIVSASNGTIKVHLTPANLNTNSRATALAWQCIVPDTNGTDVLASAFGTMTLQENTGAGSLLPPIQSNSGIVDWSRYTFYTNTISHGPYIAGSNIVFETTTNGRIRIVSQATVEAYTNGLIGKEQTDRLYYSVDNTSGYVTASITNGKASVAYVDNATNAASLDAKSNGVTVAELRVILVDGSQSGSIKFQNTTSYTNTLKPSPTGDNNITNTLPDTSGQLALKTQAEAATNGFLSGSHTWAARQYSAVDHTTTAPAGNEFPTADWVRGLAMQGAEWFFTTSRTNGFGEKTTNFLALSADAPVAVFSNVVAMTTSNYLAGGVTTNTYTALRSPISFEVYMAREGGNASSVLPVKPELYYIYNGTTNHLGDWEAAAQLVSSTTPTRFMYTIAFPEPTITGSVRVVGYVKAGVVSGTAASVAIYGGGIYPSHMDIQSAASGGGATPTLQQVVDSGPIASGIVASNRLEILHGGGATNLPALAMVYNDGGTRYEHLLVPNEASPDNNVRVQMPPGPGVLARTSDIISGGITNINVNGTLGTVADGIASVTVSGGSALSVSNVMPLAAINAGYRFGTGASNAAFYGLDSGIGVISGKSLTDATNDVNCMGFVTASTNLDECYGFYETVIPIGITNASVIFTPTFQTQTNGQPVVWRIADGINSCVVTSQVAVPNGWELLALPLPTDAKPWLREHKRIYFRGLFAGGSLTNGVPRYTLFQQPSIVQ